MNRRGESGFTLMELLIVIALIAVVAALAIPNLLSAKSNANETAAITTLRNLVSAQAQVAVAGRIDADVDGNGEFGTFLELTGSVAPRKGFTPGNATSPAFVNFSEVAADRITPPVLSASFASVNAGGFVVKAGYAFRIFLPDAALPAGFASEIGPASSIGISGATASFGVDLSETFWCAYAQPFVRGQSGGRRFFTYQRGDVLQSNNEVARRDGTGDFPGNHAFLGTGATSAVAVSATGQDGDLWRVVN